MSQTQKVFDASGVWITNTGRFGFIDPTNGCRFEPGVRTQAPVTDWVKSQGELFSLEVVEKPTKKPRSTEQ